MTYRSESRGLMYTAPPGPDDETENRPTDVEATDAVETVENTASETATETTASEGSPELESTTAATDANWTGTVSADD